MGCCILLIFSHCNTFSPLGHPLTFMGSLCATKAQFAALLLVANFRPTCFPIVVASLREARQRIFTPSLIFLREREREKKRNFFDVEIWILGRCFRPHYHYCCSAPRCSLSFLEQLILFKVHLSLSLIRSDA